MTPGHDEGAGDPAPFVRPGPPPARETLAGWQQWRAARDSFTPAPRLDRAAWRALPPRRRMLYDLHRAATHANLPLQQTPMSQAVTRVLRGRIESQRAQEQAVDPRRGDDHRRRLPGQDRDRLRGRRRLRGRLAGTAPSPWSSWTGSATTPRPRSPPGPGTWPASSSSCGCWTPPPACSPAAPCPKTSTAAPAESSACWSG